LLMKVCVSSDGFIQYFLWYDIYRHQSIPLIWYIYLFFNYICTYFKELYITHHKNRSLFCTRCREPRHQLLKGDNTDTGRSHTWTQPSLFVNMFLSLQNVIFEANVCLWRCVLAVMDSFSTFCDMIFTVVCKSREF
jgi:hypothetical protein